MGPKKKTVADPSIPKIKLATDFNRKIKVANKIKKKHIRKTIGQREKNNKVSKDGLKLPDIFIQKIKIKKFIYTSHQKKKQPRKYQKMLHIL